MRRKEALVDGEIYHVYNRSIADFKIFNDDADFARFRNAMRYYQVEDMPTRFSDFLKQKEVSINGFNKHFFNLSRGKEKIVKIISHSPMPTHIHFILKQLKTNGISTFMANLLDSYSRYFNTKRRRKGPLWEGKFKNVRVKTDEQLLHLTRYIHLNPVTNHLVDKPEDWPYSSYNEYLAKVKDYDRVCEYEEELEIEPAEYRKFVEDRITYQRDLAKIKKMLIDGP